MTDTTPTASTAPATEKGDVADPFPRASTRLRSLTELAIDASTEAITQLLRCHGFILDETRLIRHPATGVTVARGEDGYCIRFHVPGVPSGMGVIELPADTAFGVVEYIAAAVNSKRLADAEQVDRV